MGQAIIRYEDALQAKEAELERLLELGRLEQQDAEYGAGGQNIDVTRENMAKCIEGLFDILNTKDEQIEALVMALESAQATTQFRDQYEEWGALIKEATNE